MKAAVEEALAPLVGLPLWAGGRSLDLEWFQFGARKTVKGFRSAVGPKNDPAYAPETRLRNPI
jgi:hypothetical protein